MPLMRSKPVPTKWPLPNASSPKPMYATSGPGVLVHTYPSMDLKVVPPPVMRKKPLPYAAAETCTP